MGLVGLGAVAGTAYVWSATRVSSGAGTLTAPEALAAVEAGRLVLVDVRRPDEWAATGIAKGAVPIDMRRDDFVEAVSAALQARPGQPVAFICARGVRSRRVTEMMRALGGVEIVDIPEGMLGSSAGPGWLERGLPLDKVSQ